MSDGSEKLHQTTDANEWAQEFCKRYPMALCQIEGNEGAIGGEDFVDIMRGWFANAIETTKILGGSEVG